MLSFFNCPHLNNNALKNLKSSMDVDDVHVEGTEFYFRFWSLLRCLNITYNVLRWKVQHAQYFATDFRISPLFTIRLS